MKKLYLLSLIFLSATLNCFSQQPELIKDIANTPAGQLRSDGPSIPFIKSGNQLYWASQGGFQDNFGRELWKTDGTANGTFRLTDINHGTGDGIDPMGVMADLNGKLIFVGTPSGGEPYSLGVSDGTVAGTHLFLQLIDQVGGTNALAIESMVTFNNKVYFISAPTLGSPIYSELGVTDGTLEGTNTFIKSIDPPLGQRKFGTGQIKATTNAMYFKLVYSGSGGDHEVIYRTDGTTEGTVQIADVPQLNVVTGVAGSNFYFMNGADLWKSDGTSAAVKVATINNAPLVMYDFNGSVVISTNTSTWISDGTAGGTSKLHDLKMVSTAVVLGDKIFYVSDNAGTNLLVGSKGTSATTTSVGGIGSGAGFTFPYGFNLAVAGNKIFYPGYSLAQGVELGVSDGTNLLSITKQINPGTGSGIPPNFLHLTALNDKVVVFGDDGVHGTEPWIADGNAQGTVLIKDTRANTVDANVKTARAYRVNGRTYFTTNVANSKNYLLQRVKENPLDNEQFFTPVYTVMGDANNKLFFVNDDKIYASDGTNTVTIKDYNSNGALVATADQITSLGNNAIFQIDVSGVNLSSSDRKGRELWISDGTAAGTKILKDIGFNSSGTDAPNPNTDGIFGKISESLVVFPAADKNSQYELWKTDGTDAGTQLVKDILPGNGGSFPTGIKAFDGIAYFSAFTTVGVELWRTDGTEAGTYMVKDINEGPKSSSPRLFVKMGNFIYFFAISNNTTWSLWRTDGTEAGTKSIKDVTADISANSQPMYLTTSAGKLYFAGSDADHGRELWVSDGTPAGTRILDIQPGAEGSYPEYIVAIEGGVYFGANSGVWRTNGINTKKVGDVDPGYMSNFDGNVYFNAFASTTGREWYRLVSEPFAKQTITFAPVDHNISEGTFTLNGSSTSTLALTYSTTSTDKITVAGTTATMVSPGKVTITASQGGNDSFSAADDVSATICINPAKPVWTDANPVAVGVLQYYKNGQAVSLPLIETGDYTVTSSVDGCVSPMSDVKHVEVAGLGDEPIGVSIYPNPVKDSFYIESNSKGEIEILSSTGQVVSRHSFAGNQQIPFNVSRGIYILKVSTGNKVLVKKLVKE